MKATITATLFYKSLSMYYSQSGEFSLIYIRRRLSTDENLPYYIKRIGKNG